MSTVKTIEIEVNAGKAEKDLKGLDKGLQKVDKSVEDIGDTSKETQKEMGAFGSAIDKVTGGGVTGFRNMVKAVKAGTFSFKALGKAIFLTGLGALVITIAALVKNFGNSEEGANKLSKMLSQIGVVAGNVTDILYSLSQSVFSLLTGNLDDAAKSFEEATNRMKNFGEETKKEIALQGELADKQAELTKIERQLTVERAEANKKRADLLDKSANKEKFSAKQRIEFLEEAAKIDEEITNKEIAAARIRLEIKQQENSLSESSAQDLAEEAQLKADLINLDTARLMKAKTVTAQIVGALREEQAAHKALVDQRQAEIDGFQTQRDTLDKILIKSIGKQEQAKIKTGDVTAAIKQTQANNEIKIDELTNRQKLALTAQTLGQVTALLGENSTAAKAAGISTAVINSLLGFTEVLKSPSVIPEPFGSIQKIISAGSILASGYATVKQIASVKTPSGGGGGSPSISTPSRGTTPSAPPAFNVVGASETNQLAQSIGQEEKQPIKAFVVSNDVSDAQSLDRNIIESASIG